MVGQDNLYIFDDRRDEPILNEKMGLFHPTSSGILAISLALQMKAKKIYLLGFDYYFKGNMHFYQDYDHHKKNKIERFQMKLKKFKYFEKWAGRIVNLNPQSAIQEFKKVQIDSVL